MVHQRTFLVSLSQALQEYDFQEEDKSFVILDALSIRMQAMLTYLDGISFYFVSIPPLQLHNTLADIVAVLNGLQLRV
jgi:hypothetical protein